MFLLHPITVGLKNSNGAGGCARNWLAIEGSSPDRLSVALLGPRGQVRWAVREDLPVINLTQRDQSLREQRPEPHAGRVRMRQHTPGLDAPRELLVQPLDRVDHPNRFPR